MEESRSGGGEVSKELVGKNRLLLRTGAWTVAGNSAVEKLAKPNCAEGGRLAAEIRTWCAHDPES